MAKRNKGVGRKKAWAATMKDSPCHYCGKPRAGTVDHVIRRRHGGPNRKENCVPACSECNQLREREAEWEISRWNLGQKLAEALGTVTTGPSEEPE